MADEIFDVVDDGDMVIGQQSRREVHRLGLKHRAVHVLVFNARGELYLQRRSWLKDCFPGVWDSSASGHLDRGESYDAAAVRELKEELGWEAAVLPRRLFRVAACAATGQEFVWVYRCDAEGPFQLQPEEVAEGGWFPLGQVDAWVRTRPNDFASSFPLIWREMRQRGLVTGD